MKKVIQPRIVQVVVVQKEIVEYYCDRCGKRCGTRENMKSTWYGPRTALSPPRVRGTEKHYCLKTCHPGMHPSWELRHVLDCELCFRDANDRQDGMHIRIAEHILRTLGGD